ncbi:helix-turn-helix domain-containing protein [Rathayibacter sp. YIM 133350]|uniref:GbsR/MarR family transcriptional regulator n=1 Tax=Rathayibacter sp. YIM 133350 TaxID=3131992 RepID=UPI00307F5E64
MARDEKAIADYVEQSAAALTAAGFPRMPARVLMALMVSDSDGLTAPELADYLGVSAAAISGAVRYLQTVRMVHRVSQQGSRLDRYDLPAHAWYAATLGHNPTYDTILALAKAARPAFGNEDATGAQRVQEMAEFFTFVERRLPQLLEEWYAQRPARP